MIMCYMIKFIWHMILKRIKRVSKLVKMGICKRVIRSNRGKVGFHKDVH